MDTSKNEITTGTQGGKLEVKVGTTVLNVVDPDIAALFIEPKPSDGTMIASLLSRCVVPVGKGVFQIPEQLLAHITREAKTAEQMAPIEICEILRQLSAFKIDTGSQAMSMLNDDPIDMFLCDAVSNAEGLVGKFTGSVEEFCRAIVDLQDKYASEKAHYRREAMGSTVYEISKQVLMTPIQNFVLDLNRMAAGTGGYRILALLKALDKVAGFIADPIIQKMYSTGSPITMLNRLNIRIEPKEMELHDNLAKLMEIVTEIAEISGDVPKEKTGELMMVCENTLSQLSPKSAPDDDNY